MLDYILFHCFLNENKVLEYYGAKTLEMRSLPLFWRFSVANCGEL